MQSHPVILLMIMWLGSAIHGTFVTATSSLRRHGLDHHHHDHLQYHEERALSESIPTITSDDTAEVEEGTRFVIDVNAIDDTTTEVDCGFGFEIVDGVDRDLFEIDNCTGVLLFKHVPVFDDMGTNEYVVEIMVIDNGGHIATQIITATVIQRTGAEPYITSANTVEAQEGFEFVIDVNAIDDIDNEIDCELHYAVVGGANGDLFRIQSCSGKLYFKDAQVYDGNGDNDYEVQISVEDQDSNIVTQVIEVTVLPRTRDYPVITNDEGVIVVEGTTFVIDLETVDDSSTEANDELTYSFSRGRNDDSHLFTIDEHTGVIEFWNAPVYENPQDFDGDNFYNLEVEVRDKNGRSNRPFTLSVLVVADVSDASDDGDGGGPGCFALSTTTVVSKTKGVIPIEQLQVGDEILSKDGQYDMVYAIPHYHPTEMTKFLQIYISTTSTKNLDGRNSILEVTPDHLIYVMGKNSPIPASLLKQNDILLASHSYDDDHEDRPVITITKIIPITKQGLIAPFTKSGTLVVNSGIVASTYITTLPEQTEYLELLDGIPIVLRHHDIVHLAHAPYRLFCTVVPSICSNENRDEEGLTPYVQLAIRVRDWYVMMSNHPWFQLTLIGVLFIVFGPIAIVCEMVVSSTDFATTTGGIGVVVMVVVAVVVPMLLFYGSYQLAWSLTTRTTIKGKKVM